MKNFMCILSILLQNDPETGRIFSQPPLISLKHDKNIGNFLVRSALAKYQDLSDLLRSPIASHVPPQMSFIA